MQLKDYQNDVLESLSRYLWVLAVRREAAEEVFEFQRSKGRDAKLADYCRETWDALHADKVLPLMKDKDGNAIAPQYVARKDGLERPVPNICLKVPTGGGKTLLGTVAVERINAEYFKKQTGFVLWIVPSDAIYSQTWKAFANREHPYRQMLERASGVRNNEGRYIRPILLIRVERTGKEQRDKSTIHSEDVREYLVEKLGAQPDEVRVKSAEMDELGDENLLSELSKVRYIITKDALREGWDCPFAYVLAVLSKTTATTALTQMIGRVLRQPEAKLTGTPSLNECYVFTFDQEVQAAVDSVRRGLEEEGMGDLTANVRAVGKGAGIVSRRESVRRRKELERLKVFLPRILSRHYATGNWRQFDYDRDLLSRLDWSQFSYTNRSTFTPDAKDAIERTLVRVSVEDLGGMDDELPKLESFETSAEMELDLPALVRLLLDVIPNPWQGARVLNETLTELRRRKLSEKRIFANRLFLVKAIRDDLKEQVGKATELEFRRMLSVDELSFRLEASNDPILNWELAETLELDVTDEDKVLLRKNGELLEKSLFTPVYQRQVNGLEKDVAWYLDGDKAVHWWHRIAVHQDWHLQGWQRSRIYPDFLACLHDAGDGKIRFTVLETKGLHLKGNDDTVYKQRLFELLTEHSQSALSVGELKLGLKQQQMRFELMLENNWRERLATIGP